jgi:hypothetical protein
MTTTDTHDALSLLREEHHRMAAMVLWAIDIVDVAQRSGHRIDVQKMREKFGPKIRESLVGRELALTSLGDPLAEISCVSCGAAADLLADEPLGVWTIAIDDPASFGVLCGECAARDGGDA